MRVRGDTGVAGPWARAAQPRDRLQLMGPGGGYAPRGDADWQLLMGDASVVPAIGATLERLPDSAVAVVVLAAERQPLPEPPGASVHWVDDLRAAVVELEFPAGTPAPEGDFDALLMGARGLGRIGSLVLGSVSARVLHEAPIEVAVFTRRRPGGTGPARADLPATMVFHC